MNQIVTALKNHQYLHISHQSFTKMKPSGYLFEPYLLKRFNGRYYLNGFSVGKDDQKKALNLSLDRIFEMDSDEAVFIYDTNYVKTQPIHSSQVVVKEDSDRCVIEFFVRPNFELKQKIALSQY